MIKHVGHGRVILDVQTGEVSLFLYDIQALVRHLPHRDNYNIDIHTPSGVFTIVDASDYMFDKLNTLWIGWKLASDHESQVTGGEED